MQYINKKKIHLSALISFLFCIHLGCIAQSVDSTVNQSAYPVDTSFLAKIKLLREAGVKEAQKSTVKFRNDRNALRQEDLVEAIKTTIEQAKVYMKNIDTIPISRELDHIREWNHNSGDGIFYNTGTAHTYRNLTTTGNIFKELLSRLSKRKDQVDRYERELLGFRYQIDSLSADTALYDFSADSAVLIQYLQKLVVAVQTINPVDSALTKEISGVRAIQTRINTQLYKLGSDIEHIDDQQKKLSSEIFDREFANIWGDVGYTRPFAEIFHASLQKGKLVLKFYIQNNPFKVLLLFALVISATLFLSSLKKIFEDQKLLRADFKGQLVFRYPLLTAIVLVFNLFQFIFTEPPFVFNALLWTSSAISLAIILKGFIAPYWMRVWLIMLLLFVLACFNNLVLQATRLERWGMMGLSVIGIITGAIVLIKGERMQLREKMILYFLGLAIFVEIAAVIANISGRYNLAKTLLVTGYLNVIIGILFLWTIRFINEGLLLASSVYTKQERKLFFINFELVGEKSPTLLYVLLVLGWFLLMGRNVYAFRLLTDPLKNFFFEQRTIGSYSFSISSLLVFFLVVSVAIIISKIVSYFASDKNSFHSNTGQDRKVGLGSWILLVRVSIITIGLLLGLAASGFPMDRITIVIGALGLGVGLGLQTLVNHLVSGLIIAFEKPVNVGDVVEVSGQSGTMKSIGFRSSVLTSSTGADVIIPNGDLLNAHLVNWSLGGGKRRIEIVIGVSYKTDLTKTREIIRGLLDAHEKIIKFPEPDIQFQDFNNNAINTKILFWVRDFRDASTVRSEIIIAIDKAFTENGITIPFTQHDVHIIQPGIAGNNTNANKANP